ncbi:M56 family metallopeptidase [Wukongibacter sp. M2B1]|uniref:M56 family metallopeptidase n=1 Tax=Wukongibacter sp. M2B1 TaxID=3088895 RepID=UPI003D7B2442
MLEQLFIEILNMSYIGSIVILFVLIARIFLKKTPKIYSYLLWAVALIRLIIPFSFESVLSFVPVNPEPIPNDIMYTTTPQINTGISTVDHSISGYLSAPEAIASVNPMQIWIFIGSLLWFIGMTALLVYGWMSYMKMKRKLDDASREKDNIYCSNNVDTPFVLGLIQPKIHLPISIQI